MNFDNFPNKFDSDDATPYEDKLINVINNYASTSKTDLNPNTIFNIPQDKSRLIINTNLIVGFKEQMPNIWIRFWYKILLDWKWEKVG